MSETRPGTTPPRWASDTNFTNGPKAGTPTKLTPSAGEAAEGYVPGAFFPGQFLNYISHWVTGWVRYLLEFTTGSGVTAEFVYPDAKTKQIRLPFEMAGLNGPNPWEYDSPYLLRGPLAQQVVYFPLQTLLPNGAVITEIEAVVNPAAARTGGNRMSIRLDGYKGSDQTTGNLAGPVFDDTTTTLQTITLSDDVSAPALPYTVDYSTWPALAVSVSSGASAGTEDALHEVVVTYTDAGPRNPGIQI